MEINPSYTQKLRIRPMASPSQESFFRRVATADEISKWSNGALPIPMLMRFQSAKGEQFVRRCWDDARKSDAKDKIRLFKWLYGKTKIDLTIN